MSRKVLYVAHCVRPTKEEVDAHYANGVFGAHGTAARANVDRAMAWLRWMRRSFPETTFIAPWIASILSGDDDADPAQRESGLLDDCAVVERCDGIVLCGPRISEGMRREKAHGQMSAWREVWSEQSVEPFEVYDLTGWTIEGAAGRNEDGRTFEAWMDGYRESRTR